MQKHTKRLPTSEANSFLLAAQRLSSPHRRTYRHLPPSAFDKIVHGLRTPAKQLNTRPRLLIHQLVLRQRSPEQHLRQPRHTPEDRSLESTSQLKMKARSASTKDQETSRFYMAMFDHLSSPLAFAQGVLLACNLRLPTLADASFHQLSMSTCKSGSVICRQWLVKLAKHCFIVGAELQRLQGGTPIGT